MNTPIVDFLNQYRESNVSRLHMPGHKGIPHLGPEPMDITEVKGADELYFADGIIAESEENAARLFGTGITCYSTEGSSHGIRSMLILAMQLYAPKGIRPLILAARNAHKAFLYGAALCDMDVEWLYPDEAAQNSVAACSISPDALRERLSAMQTAGRLPFAFYVTSPDYLGQRADVAGLSGVCHAFGLPLLVDNAHGAYLHFLPIPQHPMDLGADLCCDSAHKTFPVLTGGAYLHMRSAALTRDEVKAVMAMTGTSSPSYLIMASLDLCNRTLSEGYRGHLANFVARFDVWKEQLSEAGVPVLASEPLKAVINASAIGYTGTELGDLLRRYQAEPEFCDADYLVLMVTPDTTAQDLERTAAALAAAVSEHRASLTPVSLHLHPLPRRLGIREAVFARSVFIPVEEAVGRICGSPAISCPPAIPIAVSGEEITPDAVAIMQACGIEKVSVIDG